MREKLEKSLKKFLKRKTTITMAMVVVFLITGNVGYGKDLLPGKINAGTYEDKIIGNNNFISNTKVTDEIYTFEKGASITAIDKPNSSATRNRKSTVWVNGKGNQTTIQTGGDLVINNESNKKRVEDKKKGYPIYNIGLGVNGGLSDDKIKNGNISEEVGKLVVQGTSPDGNNLTITATNSVGEAAAVWAGDGGSLVLGNKETNKDIINILGDNKGVEANDRSNLEVYGQIITIRSEDKEGSYTNSVGAYVGGKGYSKENIGNATLTIGNSETNIVDIYGTAIGFAVQDHSQGSVVGKYIYIGAEGENIENGEGDGVYSGGYAEDNSTTVATVGESGVTEYVHIRGKNHGISGENSSTTNVYGDSILIDSDYIGIKSGVLAELKEAKGATVNVGDEKTQILQIVSKEKGVYSEVGGTTNLTGETISILGGNYIENGSINDTIQKGSKGIDIVTDGKVNLNGNQVFVSGDTGISMNTGTLNIGGKDKGSSSSLTQILGESIGVDVSNGGKIEINSKDILVAGTNGINSSGSSINLQGSGVVGVCADRNIANSVGINSTESTISLVGNTIQVVGESGLVANNSSVNVTGRDGVQILGGTTGIDLVDSSLDITSKNIVITGKENGIKVKDNLVNLKGEKVVQILADKNSTGSVGLDITSSGDVKLTGTQVAITGDKGINLEEGSFTLNDEKMPLSISNQNFIVDSNSRGIDVKDGSVDINSGDIVILTNDKLVGDKLGGETEKASIGINSISSEVKLSGNNFITQAGYIGVKAESGSNMDIDADTITIYSNRAGVVAHDKSNIDLTGKNIYISGNYSSQVPLKEENNRYENLNNDNLNMVYSVVYSYDSDINFTGERIVINSWNTAYGDLSPIESGKEYVAVHARGGSSVNFNGGTEIYSPNGVALFATDLRGNNGTDKGIIEDKSTITLSSVGNHKIFGDIMAGTNSHISIQGQGNTIGSLGFADADEVMAINGGTIDIDLRGNGILVGRVDDYHKMMDGNDGFKFRNPKFYQEISKAGEITLNMDNGSTWVAIGQNYVTNLDMGNGAIVDMGTRFEDRGNSVHVQKISGEGTFRMYLNSEILLDNAQNKNVKTDMLYIQNVEIKEGQEKANYTIDTIGGDVLTHLKAGDRLRFATVGGENADKVNFTVNTAKEFGIMNVDFEVGNEYYDKTQDEENSKYNGSETTNLKPGNSLVDNEFGGSEIMPLVDEEGNLQNTPGQNYYLTRGEERENDIAKKIVEVANATYANAVFLDNLNKRLGDMSFATGDEGIWVRMRNDRVGEDNYYRLNNFMTQLGYDKKYVMDNGDEHRGLAFEYGQGKLHFKDETGGETRSDRYILTLYDTRVRNNGVYTDYTLRGGAISTKLDAYGVETGAELKGKYKNMLLGAGVEGGKRFDINEKWYFESQLQAQYTYISSTDYTTNQGTDVDLDSIHSLIGRAGFRLGHDYYNENGKDNTIYVKADINHEFLGDEKLVAKDSTSTTELRKERKNDGTWFDIGLGGAKNITPDFNVYMDVERQFGDNRDSNSWQFNLGFRYRFNELKELNPVVMLRDFSLRADNYFDFDKSTLKPEGKKVIKEVSEDLMKERVSGTLKIEGHTDWTGTREYNQGLSERRAKSVEEELRKNITTDKIKYETVGYGEDRPIADNKTKEGRAKNRRVDIKFEGVVEK